MTQSTSLSGIGLRLGVLALIDAFAIWFIYQIVALGGNIYIAGMMGFIALGLNIIFLSDKLYALR